METREFTIDGYTAMKDSIGNRALVCNTEGGYPIIHEDGMFDILYLSVMFCSIEYSFQCNFG